MWLSLLSRRVPSNDNVRRLDRMTLDWARAGGPARQVGLLLGQFQCGGAKSEDRMSNFYVAVGVAWAGGKERKKNSTDSYIVRTGAVRSPAGVLLSISFLSCFVLIQ